MSPSPLDEFGSTSLEEMFEETFADLPADPDRQWGDTVKVEHTYTKTHLVAMFTSYRCRSCSRRQDIAQGYAVRKLHHTRNQMIEFQVIHSSESGLYESLPWLRKFIDHDVPFCNHCLDGSFAEIDQ